MPRENPGYAYVCLYSLTVHVEMSVYYYDYYYYYSRFPLYVSIKIQ